MIEELKSFVTVVEEASLTRAAQKLFVTQSAVSKRIQRLEDVLGAQLLDRNSKPPRATALAHRIHEHAVPLLAAFNPSTITSVDTSRPWNSSSSKVKGARWFRVVRRCLPSRTVDGF